MSLEGTLRVVLTSRMVPVSTYAVERPTYSISGVRLGTQKMTRLVYQKSLDPSDQIVLDEARKLSSSLGLGLEVVDRTDQGMLRRFVAALSGRGPGTARFVFSPAARAGVAAGPAVALGEQACSPA